MYLKSLTIFKNRSQQLKKASISLEMSSKTIENFKKASNSLKIYLKCHAFLKASHFEKRASRQLPHCYNGQSSPGRRPKCARFFGPN
jgi:hypothetical protein